MNIITTQPRAKSERKSEYPRLFFLLRVIIEQQRGNVTIPRQTHSYRTLALMTSPGSRTTQQEPTFKSVMTEKTALFEELQEEDYYVKFKKLTRHIEMLDLQESYIKDEQANLKRELIRAQEEVKRGGAYWPTGKTFVDGPGMGTVEVKGRYWPAP